MKKTLLLLLSFTCLAAHSGRTQITINASDMPVANEIYTFSIAADSSVTNPEQNTSAGHTWDFSGLTEINTSVDSFKAVSNTPYASDYPTADHGKPVEFPAPDSVDVPVKEVVNYYSNTGNNGKYKMIGFGGTVESSFGDIQFPIHGNPDDTIYDFPLVYGDTDSSYALYREDDNPSVVKYVQEKVRVDTVDGWGTVYLPNDTFQVLRVKSTVNMEDTIYFPSQNIDTVITRPERIDYKFLAQGEGTPVLKIITRDVAGSHVVNNVQYKKSQGISSIGDVEGPDMLLNWEIRPVPSKGPIQIEWNDRVDGRLTLKGMDGRTHYSSDLNQKSKHHLNVSHLAQGIYFLEYKGTDVRLVEKIVVE